MSAADFDIIVIGAGHAGIEASLSCARLGLNTLTITTNISRIGYMSCNPAIGGLAKGHMVREIDVLGGQMGLTTDQSCIQFKRLNASKGPAVRGSRAQCDKDEYSRIMTETLQSIQNLRVLEAEVKSLVISENTIRGVVLNDGSQISARAVVITAGTFMNAVMHVGSVTAAGGRVGDKASVGLSDQLKDLGFRVTRLKTGTPARLHKDSIDWTKTSPQGGDARFYPFSIHSKAELRLPQVYCYMSHTNEKTHEIIRQSIHLSPMHCGRIEGTGPRYCPSIEDKVTRFVEKASHQTFLEPEGLNTPLIYLQGISTSLPQEIQDQFLRTIPGLENVKVVRYGYAVEYDFLDPVQLDISLQTKSIGGLFLAGQINGTSGYEEAAAQGLIAGVNAVNYVKNREPLVLGRDQAYIGVLLDDLVTKGTKEPYRMFTSRAEHRLVLREDNTLERLLETGLKIGLVNDEAARIAENNLNQRQQLKRSLEELKFTPSEETQRWLKGLGTPPLLKPVRGTELVRRSEIGIQDLSHHFPAFSTNPNVYEPVEIEIKYSGYVDRQRILIEQAKRLSNFQLDSQFDYSSIVGLSAEEKEKLNTVKPRDLGQASRISGVNPSAIQAIVVHMKMHRVSKTEGRRDVSSSAKGEKRGASRALLENTRVVS